MSAFGELVKRVTNELYAKETRATQNGDYRGAGAYREAVEVVVKTARGLGWKENQ